MNTETIEVVMKAIRRRSPLGPDIELSSDTNLIRTGILDSLALFGVVEDLEREMGQAIPEDEIHPKNFRTARSIAAVVLSARGGSVEAST